MIAPGCAGGSYLEADYIERTAITRWAGGGVIREIVNVRELNVRMFRHEAETPMRGHDVDGDCCRRAALGGDGPT